jgi:hypothetical protein
VTLLEVLEEEDVWRHCLGRSEWWRAFEQADMGSGEAVNGPRRFAIRAELMDLWPMGWELWKLRTVKPQLNKIIIECRWEDNFLTIKKRNRSLQCL